MGGGQESPQFCLCCSWHSLRQGAQEKMQFGGTADGVGQPGFGLDGARLKVGPQE